MTFSTRVLGSPELARTGSAIPEQRPKKTQDKKLISVALPLGKLQPKSLDENTEKPEWRGECTLPLNFGTPGSLL